jgi:hypothetical protein
MTHLHDESGQSRAQHNHSRARRRGAYRSPRRPVVVAALSLIAVVAGGLAANEVASAPSSDVSPVTETSLWSADVRPVQPADSDTRSVELGTSFRTSQAGAVTGIRFYKHPENTGRHTGRLWDDRGRLLASVTFDNEAASGWQVARLASPVALQTGRWYVVSYHAPTGRYAADPNYFRNRMLTSGVLQARAGVYAYGGEARYPTRTWRNASYYADVLFVPATESTTTPTTPAPTTASPTTPPPTTTPAPTTTAPPPPTTTPPPMTTLSPTTPPTPTTTAPAPVGQVCTSPVFRTSDSNGGWSEGGYYVHNNMWNISKYPSLKETLEACSHASWNVTATADDNAHNGEVKTYPNVHKDFQGSGAYGEPAWSSFKTMRSTFAAQGPGVGIYNIAYDIWMNGVPGNREIMIWTENHGQRPAGDIVASGVSFSGITWDVWATGDNGYLAFTPKSTLPSGSLDLKAMIDYLVAHGRVPASSTLGQVCFGVEVVSTDGKPATFRFTDFSLTSS